MELVPEMVLGEGRTDPVYLFSQASGFDVASDGRIFVADRESDEIRVFDPSGDHMQTFGRSGQGPGDFLFSEAGWVTLEVAGDRVFVYDDELRRFSVWSTDGIHLRDGRSFTGRQTPNGFQAVDETTLVARLQTRLERRERHGRWSRYTIALLDADGRPVRTLSEREAPPTAVWSEALETSVGVIPPRYGFHVDPGPPTVYVTPQ